MRLIATTAIGLALIVPTMPAHADERRLPLPGFDRMRLSGPVTATVTAGRGTSILASGDRRALESLVARVDGRLLVVTAAGDAPVTLTITTSDVAGVQLAGPATLSVDRVRGDRVRLSAEGASRLTIGQMRVDRLDLVASGGSRVTAAGTATMAIISTQGSAEVDAANLRTDRLTIASQGDGEIRAQARQDARVNVEGSGAITVTGGPNCAVTQRGVGTVRCGR